MLVNYNVQTNEILIVLHNSWKLKVYKVKSLN